jgi:hypothetical protein
MTLLPRLGHQGIFYEKSVKSEAGIIVEMFPESLDEETHMA